MIMDGFGCTLSYWTRQAIKEGSLKICPITSEREAFNSFSFGKVTGFMPNRFFFDVKDRMGWTLLTSGQTITAQNLKTLIRYLSILGLGGRFVS